MSITHWHEADDFWETLAPIFFESGRWEVAPREVDGIVALLDAEPGAPILDLCCGPGRHALELARRGYRVTGVDRTEAFLTIARGEADGLPVEFVRDDMRRFCRPEAFAAVLNLFSSFGYFDDPADDRQALAQMYRSLRPGGTLVLDLVGKEVYARRLGGKTWTEWDGGFLLEEATVTQDWGWLQNRWVVILAEEGIGEFLWGYRLYSARELSALLQDAGFADIRLLGDLGGGPYDQTASRLVAVARKPH